MQFVIVKLYKVMYFKFKLKKINNSFENSSIVVTVSKHFSKFSENFFIYSEFLNILTCILSLILYDSIH